MTKKRVTIKDRRVRILLKEGGRMEAKKDFYELLHRAVTTPLTKTGTTNSN